MKGERIAATRFAGILLLASLYMGCVNSPHSESLTSALHSVASPPETEITREIGQYDLPFQPNERFILEWVYPEREVAGETDLILVYYLDGKRREWIMGGPRSTDGYVTELGWFLESSPIDGNLMEERVIRLPSGEQITVSGNTFQQGHQVRLRSLESSEHERFGRGNIAEYGEG